MALEPELTYRRLRAPRHDRGVLLDPAWSECISATERNSRHLADLQVDWLGKDFQSLRRQARRFLVVEACRYTQRYLDAPWCAEIQTQVQDDQEEVQAAGQRRPLILSGHQPALFHPGVWAKNFAIDRLSRDTGGLAVQVIIDNDLMRDHAIVCPTGEPTSPIRVSEPFDQFQQPIPYEMRFVQDRELFDSFAERVTERVKPLFTQQQVSEQLISQPIVQELWPYAQQALDRGKSLGHAFAEARHRIEVQWGLRTLEIPLSSLCESDVFRWYVAFWFLNLSRAQSCYNRRLEEYRQVHGIRNRAQPLPDLEQRDGWQEVPFWIWSDQDPARRPVWLALDGNTLCLGDGAGEIAKLDLSSPSLIVEQLDGLSQRGYRLRPKALATTMFLRLFFADFFFHGIGGAKYDQVTDLILFDLLQTAPPRFGVLSLTTLLPNPEPLVEPCEIIHKQQQIRQMFFHPERFFADEKHRIPKVSSKVKTKQKLLREKPERGKAAAWHRELERVNALLREDLHKKSEKEKRILRELMVRSRQLESYRSREWSFCLFPPELLRERLLDLEYPNF